MGVVEAAGLSVADGANRHAKSIESFRDPGSSGFSATRRDDITMKLLIAFCAMASSSGMVKQRMG